MRPGNSPRTVPYPGFWAKQLENCKVGDIDAYGSFPSRVVFRACQTLRFSLCYSCAKDERQLMKAILSNPILGADFLLCYIGLVLENYEKELKKENPETHKKNFKYPPVLPIVFYDGKGKWTAELDFRNKVRHSELFGNLIPSFEYIVVELNKYSMEDITKCMDALSIIMLLDRSKSAADMEYFLKLPEKYQAYVKGLKIPAQLRELILRAIKLLSTKQTMPKAFVEKVEDRLNTGGVKEMFDGIAEVFKDMRKQANQYKSQSEQYKSQTEQYRKVIESLQRENAELKGRAGKSS
jgi:hypothetical protein